MVQCQGTFIVSTRENKEYLFFGEGETHWHACRDQTKPGEETTNRRIETFAWHWIAIGLCPDIDFEIDRRPKDTKKKKNSIAMFLRWNRREKIPKLSEIKKLMSNTHGWFSALFWHPRRRCRSVSSLRSWEVQRLWVRWKSFQSKWDNRFEDVNRKIDQHLLELERVEHHRHAEAIDEHWP